MSWLQGILQAHPEIAFFLVLGLGYAFGKISLGSFTLGAVTGTLLAGVLVGQLDITLPNEVKQCFFLLFLFAIGFRTGPQFFRGLKSDGLQHAALAAIVAHDRAGRRLAGRGPVRLRRRHGGRPRRRCAHRVGDDRHRHGRHLAPRPARGRAHRAHQQHPGRLRGHLSRRRDRRGLGAVAAGAEAPAHRSRGGVPQARGADAGRRGPAGVRLARIRVPRLRRRSGLPFRRAQRRRGRGIRTGSADLRRAGPQSRRDRRGARRRRTARPATSIAIAGRRTTLVEVLEAPGAACARWTTTNCSTCRARSSTS